MSKESSIKISSQSDNVSSWIFKTINTCYCM